MSRYVDIEPFEKEGWYMARVYNDSLTSQTYETKKLKEIPSADVVERKTGEWVKMSDADGEYYACSFCGEDLPRYSMEKVTLDNPFPPLYSIDKTTFCPNCGADLRKEVDS